MILRFVWELINRRCFVSSHAMWSGFLSLMVAAAPAQLDQSNFTLDEPVHWLATHDELVVGMPSAAWPPHVYTDGAAISPAPG